MQVYLPIAEIPVNMFVIFGMGGAVGFLSGLFGIGGGFLLTPLLIFSGIPPAVSVATVTTQVVASSASAVVTYWRRKAIDLKLATMLLIGGVVGSLLGVILFDVLQSVGQLDLVISLAYVTFLGAIGSLMLIESVRAIRRRKSGARVTARRPGQHNWIHGLPFKMRFRQSKLYVSVLPILALGGIIGFLGTVLGIGGGFMMVPALIYLLRVPTNIVIGTSLLQIMFTMAAATIFHSIGTQTVDIVLALTLMIGGVIGAQFGARMGQNLRGDQLRLLLALLVLLVGMRFAIDLLLTPEDFYSIAIMKGAGA
ncbi:sulfite exporter TauE/SafE family protein [Roseibium polysiphoniae]|uniref:Probable membrane transporter protein n=1 Tax=Roseibium polysiphoniae TaxID=2571221 RepID=A0A927Q341_9HYPH|nr:sulfite exporter TauE/SafE family protein [Roseibium polysiphoniae]MBS8261173.1 sulfite exporter TauE/SafE family protein [Roseibium polysiphoniae]